MSACFAAFRNNSISTTAFHTTRKSSRCNYRNNGNARFLPHRNIRTRISCSCGNYINFHIGSKLSKLGCFRIHEHNIQTDWFISQFTSLFNFCFYPRYRSSATSNNAQASSITYRSSKTGISNVCHTALNNRIFNTQKLSYSCFHI
ncbi:unknown [Cryptobacterium sp. CAG:338]|nr:unknown [Cryptobacterium sp. CAG:338]